VLARFDRLGELVAHGVDARTGRLAFIGRQEPKFLSSQ
jgi:hypothetical protein